MIIAGNSHTAALAQAPHDGTTIFALGNGKHEIAPFSRPTPSGVELLPEQYAGNLLRFTGRSVITPGERWGLLVVNHNARVYRDPTWLSHEPAEIAAPGTTPVTRGLITHLVERDQAGVRLFLKHLQTAGVDLVAISAPAPRRDHPAIRRGTRPEVVAHIDRLARRTWADWLAAHGIPLVDPPPGTTDDDGLLRAEYAAGEVRPGVRDPHHANAAYGALMLERVLSA